MPADTVPLAGRNGGFGTCTVGAQRTGLVSGQKKRVFTSLCSSPQTESS